MAGKMRRAAAFTALWKALVANREGPSFGTRLAAFPRLVWQSLVGRYDGGARVLMMLGGWPTSRPRSTSFRRRCF